MDTTPLWLSAPQPEYPALDGDLEVDVLIVGGGITGITTAFLLKKSGHRVALVERDRLAEGESGHTTAHLTHVMDLRLTELVKAFGRQHAQAAWDAGSFAIDQIASLVAQEELDCSFQRVPAYLYAALDADVEKEGEKLHREAHLAAELGFDADYISSVPVTGRPGIRFANQAKFHPVRYLSQLAARIPGDGCQVFENTEVTEFFDDPCSARANENLVRFRRCVIATHVPLQGCNSMLDAMMRQTKLASYSTYAVGGSIPKGLYPESSLWDTADPYLYVRFDRGVERDYVIIGGGDHKTGQADACDSYEEVSRIARSLLPDVALDRRWSGQVVETVDGLPFIGETVPGQFVATGYAGNGMTFGTLAAVMARDWILGLVNPWTDLFGVERKKLSATWDYLTENKDYPFYLAKGALQAADTDCLEDVPRNEGRIVRLDGRKAAVYRSEDGALSTRTAVCTHLGCIVTWNAAEKTWDCPCHGSRFQTTGEVISGPAEEPLTSHRAS
jgi:glycine/D-amino acid oxidase-like deaminating enzyme/nitrite reductase/ring-hydroxylating ferredoxin subunit